MKSTILKISQSSKFTIQLREIDKDHIHLLVDAVPEICPTQIVRKLKQESTVAVWKEFPMLLK